MSRNNYSTYHHTQNQLGKGYSTDLVSTHVTIYSLYIEEKIRNTIAHKTTDDYLERTILELKIAF